MSSPVKIFHSQPHGSIMGWLAVYCAATPGVDLEDNTTVRLDADREPQPYGLLRIEKGQSRIDEDGYIEGAPELIVEIAASSASYDLGDKLQVYRRNGVQEYIIWQIRDRAIDWFRLQNGKYLKLQADTKDIIRSEIFPGLWLATTALLANNLAEVLKVLQQGLETSEHQEFIGNLGAE